MSLITLGIGAAKKVKHRFQDQIRSRTPVYLSPVRRIERVALKERLCAMTFDDGPCRLPANPDDFGGRPLTQVLLDTLERYGAKGTFDVVGDTSANYPDTAGREGSPAWGGVAYDHYPDFQKDADGGAEHCPELISRILEGGHEITSHTYAHVLFGKKSLVYGKRHHLDTLEQAVEDLERLDGLLKEKWGYAIRLSRPPHYVDNIAGGFSSYDAYALMGYQYLAASFDGAGWLPLPSYQGEVEATWRPIEERLNQDPNYFCGQIIFQKDGYNMARRSPIAHGLERQLELLTARGYQVVTVSELLSRSPFLDVGPETSAGRDAQVLLRAGWCPAFRDNSLRPESVLTRGELAMMVYGWPGARRRVEGIRQGHSPCADVKPDHPYAGAIALALEAGSMELEQGRFHPQRAVSPHEARALLAAVTGITLREGDGPMTHGRFFALAAPLLEEKKQ